MNFMRRLGNRNLFKAFGLVDVSYTSHRAIERIVHSWENSIERDYCLDIGASGHDDHYITLCIDGEADYVGDVRALFAPQGGYTITESLLSLPEHFFQLVRLSHFIEHIEWLYQRALFEWLFEFVADDGHIVIETPNLDYIINMYQDNMHKLARGKQISYPYREHPDFYTDGETVDLVSHFVPWINYKLYSGCSYEGTYYDYHLACFNAYWLGLLLEQAGFVTVRIYSGKSLYAVASKPGGDAQWEY